MALNLKQILTVGIGLGVATACGYHLLTRPTPSSSDADAVSELKPIQSFDLEPVRLPQPLDQPAMASSASDPADFETPSAGAELSAVSISSDPSDDVEPLSNSGLSLEAPVDVESPAAFELDALIAGSGSAPQTETTTDLELAPPESNSTELSLSSAEPRLDLSESPTAPVEMLTGTGTEPEMIPAPNGLPSQTDNSAIDSSPAPVKTAMPKTDTPVETPRGWKANPFMKDADSASRWGISLAEPVAAIADNASTAQVTALQQDQELPPSTSVLSLVEPEMNSAAAPQVVASIPDRDVAMLNEPSVDRRHVPLQEADAQRAVHHVEYGKTLARRGASFSAREEFLKAIQLIATANDKTSGTNRHTTALRQATLIMKEAEDFATVDAEQQIQMSVANVIETHRSHVLSATEAARMTPADAIDRYFAEAQQQLDLAGGRTAVSAEAFYCLGKLHSVMSSGKQIVGPVETAQAVVFHQAALMSDPNHHRSANELGVLFAKHGRVAQAKILFERSLMVSPNLKTWHNLAQAHQRLGESEFARRAENEYRMLAQRGGDLDSLIRWKPVDQFIAETPPEYEAQVASHNEEVDAAPVAQSEQPTEEKKSLGQRLKEIF